MFNNLPPNSAIPTIVSPFATEKDVASHMIRLGTTEKDLVPIDWRKKIPISAVKNQKQCGMCWAISSTSALTDRFIFQKRIKGLNLDPVLTTQCVSQTHDNGCCGGMPYNAGKFFETVGIPEVSDDCPDFGSSETEKGECKDKRTINFPLCSSSSKCAKGKTIYKAIEGSTKTLAVKGNHFQTILNMKVALLEGPYVVTYQVPLDFMVSGHGYKWDATNGIFISGSYKEDLEKKFPDKKGINWIEPQGWHAVELIGWDIGDVSGLGKVPYWIIKNSWGEEWMENGYCKIAMNLPEKGLNSNLGLDYPIGVNGGGTTFEPDLDSGRDGLIKGGDVNKDWEGEDSFEWWWVLIIVGVIFGVIFILKKLK
jgi:hypothetical protein